jgi:predicted small lipoprotein YifL
MANNSVVRIIAALTLLVGVAACGQKGPLYMPDKGGEVVTRPATAPRPQSNETGPQPSTEPQTNTTPEKKGQQQPR